MSAALDGNAAGGPLSEVFALDATSAVTTCVSCGARNAVGALHAYLGGPGVVLRCASCEAVQLRLVSSPAGPWLDLRGVRAVQFLSQS